MTLRTIPGLLVTTLVLACCRRAVAAEQATTAPPNGLRDRTPAAHALLGGRIVVAPGRVIERGALIIRDGIIAAVGEKLDCPADCRKWDMTGKTLYAGLFDAYTELPPSEAPVRGPGYWNSQITPQRRAEEIYRPDDAIQAKYRGQGIVLRLIVPAQGIIRGTSAVVTTGDGGAAQVLVKDKVALHLEPTLRPRRERDSYPNSPMGAMALTRQALSDADWYRRAWDTYRSRVNVPRPERNVALEVLADYLHDSMPVVIDAQDEQHFLRADRLAAEFGLAAIIRGSGQEYRRLDAIRATGRPMIVPVDFPKAPNVSTPEAAAAASLEDLLDWDIAPENPARLEKAGVRFALTSHGLNDTSEFLTAVRRAVERGLSAEMALRALTIIPAELFGLADRCGTLEAGKAAHLVVATGELFAKDAKIVETWIDGRRYEPPSAPRYDLRGRWEITATPDGGSPQSLQMKLGGEPAKLSGTIRKVDATHEEATEQPPDDRTVSGAEPKKDKADDKPRSEPDASQSKGPKQDSPPKSSDGKSKQSAAKGPPKESADRKDHTRQDQAKLERPTLSDSLFTATFKGEPLDWQGVVQLSATVLAPASSAGHSDPLPEGPNAGDLQMLGRLVLADGRELPLLARRTGPYDPKADAEVKSSDVRQDAADEPATGGAAVAAEESTKPISDVEGTETKTEPPREQRREEKTAADQTPLAEKLAASEAKKAKVKIEALFPVNFPLGAFGVRSQPEQPRLVLLKNGTIWTCGPSGVIEGGALLISAGRIAAVGKDLAPPEGAQVIDLAGAHVSPGIIDCHSHIATDGGVNESGQAITAEVRIGDFVDACDINIYRQLAGGVTTINVLHGSANPIGGQNQVLKLRWGATPEEMKFAGAPPGIKFALGENVKQSNWGDRYTSRYPQTRMGVEQLIRDEFEAARAYRKRHDNWQRAPAGLPPRRDLELEAVAEILDGKRLIHCHSYRQDEILAFLRVCEDFGVRVATLQHILEGYKLADILARHGAGGSSFSDWWAYKFEVYDAIPYNGALMHNAGVLVSFNSDDAELARRLNLEAAKAIKYGNLKPEEALEFVTFNPARQLGIDQRVGSLEPGKDADFVVWSEAPLSIYCRCEQTWIDGRKYFDRQADLARRDEIKKMRNELVQKILLTQAEMETPGQERSRQRTLWPREDIFCGHHGHRVSDHLQGH
jgi:N-acetylglucosamine-6-phosphate deacetylase